MILDKLFFVLTLVAALGSGLIAGAFFIFSVAVMRALERVPGGAGIMADDVMAGVYANLALRLCLWTSGHLGLS